ncbi:MAG: enoyl-CoA hydratase [Proteobacteria bacterium]|jgi:enoyl-CoA hydratase|nr:enoyl-CoA hydratase [Pseudomonadota bacterium]
MTYETILVDYKESVALITLNRPDALNALNSLLMKELSDALKTIESDDHIHVIVITGNDKAFAAGADIKEMQDKNYIDALKEDFITSVWEDIVNCRKPVIAAVAGYALGGGCELAMMCDMIIAGQNAKFGQPEIKLGVIPGIGGTQRLTRFIGKSKAMEMILTGRLMDAEEAERSGLVARVVPTENLLIDVLEMAKKISEFSMPSVMMAKECVNKSYEMTLHEGVRFERRIFHSLFATDDQKEGMAAFIEKRSAAFKHE